MKDYNYKSTTDHINQDYLRHYLVKTGVPKKYNLPTRKIFVLEYNVPDGWEKKPQTQ